MKVLAILIICLASAADAAGWNARTTRTNTAVTDGDIQQALNQGLTLAFVNAFPDAQFGVHALVDHHQVAGSSQDLVYLSLGLSKRFPGGDYRLAEGYVSDVVLLPKGSDANSERQAVGQRLTMMAGQFSTLMVQHRSGQTPASRAAPASTHWSQWPDYRR